MLYWKSHLSMYGQNILFGLSRGTSEIPPPNILPIQWKMYILFTGGNLIALRFKSSACFWNAPGSQCFGLAVFQDCKWISHFWFLVTTVLSCIQIFCVQIILGTPLSVFFFKQLAAQWRNRMKAFSALLAICAGNWPIPGEFPHKGQWRGALMFSLICVWINGWVNNLEAGDLKRYLAHYDVTVMGYDDTVPVARFPNCCKSNCAVAVNPCTSV